MKKVIFLNLSIHKGEFMFFNTDFLKSEEIYLKLEKVSEGNQEKIMYRLIIFVSRKTCEYIGCEFSEIVKLPGNSEQYILGEREKCIYRINFK